MPSDRRRFTVMCSKRRCGRALPVEHARPAIASRWSCRQQKNGRGRERTSRCAVNSSPCFITASLGIHFAAPALPRRYPCSIWAPEHGTTRLYRSSTPRRRLRRLRRRRTRLSRRRPGYIFKQRIWRPPGEGAAADCWRRSSPAGDAAGAWAPGATCPGRPSGWTKGWLAFLRI